jgi:chromosome segregation ATPase
MAWPWLAIVARTVPWAELARRAPQIISASSELLEKRKAAARREVRIPPDEADEIELERRIRILEHRDVENVKAIEQLAEDTRELSDGLQVLAARLRLLAVVVAAAVVLGIVALLFSL